ncbi:TonB-dependent receptor [Pseudoflavitalea sp. G-6-1-2]|uniref:TonB-dependent receptor n=1 Tax=Pseudoflavitalea sp. G-6-1-2 TaxID=2728841 RepID=UPI00146D7BA3|nr:TonB-dependent receptor [Pseudoflavitalea sp. G-6-1-2]NML21346.1 TonB-dependent receptor [Pseudoflavitalea sp. G-6-1-2]
MKLTLVLLIATLMSAHAAGIAQTITLSARQMPLKQVFAEIKKQTNYVTFTSKDLLADSHPVTVSVNEMPLKDFLHLILKDQPLTFNIESSTILLSKKITAVKMDPALVIIDRSPLAGMVKNQDGEPLAGASVKVKGTDRGTTTDQDGKFTIDVNPGEVLLVSYTGYVEKEQPVGTVKMIQITLSLTDTRLQVVVIGYGSQERRKNTGAISKVTGFDAEKNVVGDVTKALQGKASGVYVSSASGTVGQAPNILIRGVQSADIGQNPPLFVIDGVIVDQYNSTVFNNIIMSLNPQDIESVDVLKDAASAAIYGSRGSNGVIIITTKKGKKSAKPSVAFSNYVGVNRPSFYRDVLNTEQYGTLFTESRNNRIGLIDAKIAGGNLTPVQIAQLNTEKTNLKQQIDALKLENRSRDFVKDIINNGLVMNQQLSVNGGSDLTNYNVSLGHYSEENSIGSGNRERYSVKLDGSHKLTRWLKLSAGVDYSRSVTKEMSFPYIAATQIRPDSPEEPVLNADGSFGFYVGQQQHPRGVLRDNNNKLLTNIVLANISAEIDIVRNLSFKSLFGLSSGSINNTTYNSPLTYTGKFDTGKYVATFNNSLNYNWDNTLNYNIRAGKLTGTATVGYVFYHAENNGNGYELRKFPMIGSVSGPAAGGTYAPPSTIATYNNAYLENALGTFARANLSYNGRYLLNLSVRNDGSSKLSPGYRYNTLPAIGTGWVLSEESFLRGNKMISFLKLRASWGKTGNIKSIGWLDRFVNYTIGNYLGQPSLHIGGAFNTLGNPALSWEATKQTDIGIDLELWNGMFTFNGSVYRKLTEGLLTSLQQPYSLGGNSYRYNLGSIRNQGIELEAGYRDEAGKFRWSVNGNLSINRNKLISMRDSTAAYGATVFGGPASRNRVGFPIGMVQVLEARGVDPETGDMIYADQDGNKIINNLDNIYVPIALPKFSGGLNIESGYRDFDLSLFWTFSYGNKVYDFYEQTLRDTRLDAFGVMPNKFTSVLDRWKQKGDPTSVPRLVAGAHGPQDQVDWNFKPSTAFIRDASYARLRNITLGYSLPAVWMKSAGIRKLRVYASFQNLFTISKAEGFDPEAVSNTGVMSSNTPNPRSFVVGFNVNL